MRSVKPAVLSAIFNLADKEEESNSQDYKGNIFILYRFNISSYIILEKSCQERKVDHRGGENWVRKSD